MSHQDEERSERIQRDENRAEDRRHQHDTVYLVIEAGHSLERLLTKLIAALKPAQGATPAEQDALADTIDDSAEQLRKATDGTTPKP